jgi:hypothetical protein
MNELMKSRLLVSIAAELELHGLRELWGMATDEKRDELMREFPLISPKWELYEQAARCAIR